MMKRKCWECALLLWLAAGLLFCVMPVQDQSALASKLTRLHVLANSDSAEDQTLKLQVRDALLTASQGLKLEDPKLLEQLQAAAQNEVLRAGYQYPVHVTREHCYFDTREYEQFSLPAGYYDAIRVLIGEGAGRNWWCVMFPPLCAGMCETDWEALAHEAGLSADEIGLICEEEGYVLRFQLMDLWGKIIGRLRKK